MIAKEWYKTVFKQVKEYDFCMEDHRNLSLIYELCTPDFLRPSLNTNISSLEVS